MRVCGGAARAGGDSGTAAIRSAVGLFLLNPCGLCRMSLFEGRNVRWNGSARSTVVNFAAMSSSPQRPIVTELRLSAFKSHRGATFPLEPLTLLAGASGTGKSSVLEGLAVLGRLASGADLQEVFAVSGTGRSFVRGERRHACRRARGPMRRAARLPDRLHHQWAARPGPPRPGRPGRTHPADRRRTAHRLGRDPSDHRPA